MTAAFNSSRSRKSRRRPYRLRLEPLESRLLLATFIVNSLGDEPDFDLGDGVSQTTFSGGVSTLRSAIQQANALANDPPGIPDEIRFNIPGGGIHTIIPASALPAITDAVIIDGYSQPGSHANTSPEGDDAVLLIELAGSNAGNGVDGLELAAGNSLVRGLVINRFGGAGIRLSSSDNIVAGNFIGANTAGTADLGNLGSGVFIRNDTQRNRIGGTIPAERNLLSGNKQDGVAVDLGAISHQVQGNFIGTDITGTHDLGNTGVGVSFLDQGRGSGGNVIGGSVAGAGNLISGNDGGGIALSGIMNGNFIQGNYIGTDVTGALAIGNGTPSSPAAGIVLASVRNTTIGGAAALERNVISGNFGTGIAFVDGQIGGPQGTLVQGNFIGTGADGFSPLGNQSHGVSSDLSGNNTIGGTVAGQGNIIAFNGGDGVSISRSSATPFLSNSMFSNGGLGIDLGGNGVTPNDPGDADTGGNNLQNFPEVASAALRGGMLTVEYVVPSATSNSAYPLRVEFFQADADGQEGQTFLGFDTYDQSEAGQMKTIVLSPSTTLSGGDRLVSTATDAAGNTSEFSLSHPVAAIANQAPFFDPVADQITEQGHSLQLHVSASDLDMLSAVVSFTNGSHFFGSGVLISPTTVLTAAHVQQLISDGETTVNFQDTAVTRTVSRSVTSPSFNFPDGDLAIVTLDSPVDIAPLALYRNNEELGLQTFLAGYGLGTLHFGTNRVSGVDSSLLYFNASSPDVFYPVSGDSGGPALINGQVAGVASFTSGNEYAYTRSGHFQTFIDELTASDPSATPLTLTFALVDGPSGAAFDPSTATFSWTPGSDVVPKTYFATIRVTDNAATPLSDELTIAIEVLPGQPTVDAGPTARIPEGSTLISLGSYAFIGNEPLSARVNYGDGTQSQELQLDEDSQSFALNHLYTADGSFRVTVTITDSLERQVSGSTTILVDNVRPRADAGGPYVFQEGSIFTLDASSSSDPGNDIVSYEWGLDGDEEFLSGTGRTFSSRVPFLSAGVYSVGLRVTDDDGDSSVARATFTITPAPVLDAVDDSVIVSEGVGITTIDVLANDISIVPELPITIILITPAEHGSVTLRSHGQSLAYTPDPQFHGTDAFTYTIEDGLGERDSATVFVRVNELPTAVLGATPEIGAPPLAVTFDASRSSPGEFDDQLVHYVWAFGDGTNQETSSPTTSHSYVHFGRFLATLVVVDSFGGQSDPTTLEILVDSMPTAVLHAPSNPGGPPVAVTFHGDSSSDPDAGDAIASYLWDFGDGATLATAIPVAVHSYVQAGIFTASLVVIDTLGGRSQPNTVRLTVNSAPTAVLDAPPSVGTPPISVLFKGQRSSDNDAGDAIAFYCWDFGDGLQLETTTSSITHIFTRSGDFSVSLTVVDTFGEPSHSVVSTVHVNARPTAVLTPVPISGPAPRTVILDALRSNAGDPGDRINSYLWNFGDGSNAFTDADHPTISHIYKGVGEFHPSAIVVDTFSAMSDPVSLTIITSGTISGSVFEDTSGNGQKEAAEQAAGGVVVYLDLNQNRTRDAGEPFVTTTATGANKGSYMLPVAGGNGIFHVRLDVSASTVTTKPVGNEQVVNLTNAASASNVQFGFFRMGSVSGTVFNDLDGNGNRNSATESGLAGFRLFLDEDNDHFPDPEEPTATTNSSGFYSFPSKVGPSSPIAPKVLPISLPASQYVTNSGGGITAMIQSGGLLSGQNLGIFTKGTIGGKVFEDVNGSGVYEASVDRLLAGRAVTVFKDSNNDNRLSPGEQVAATINTDSQGNYEFLLTIPSGPWKVTQGLPAGWVASTPPNNAYPLTVTSGSTFSGKDFGAYLPANISGVVFEDLDGDGLRDTIDPGLASWIVFLVQGQNNLRQIATSNSAANQGSFQFANLKPGTYRVREAVQPGFVAGNPSSGFRDLTLASGQIASDVFFANYRPASIMGTVFDDLDGQGGLDSSDKRLGGRSVYIDADYNGIKGDKEIAVLSDNKGKYVLGGLRPGTYQVRTVPAAGEITTAPLGGGSNVSLISNQSAAGRDFGVFKLGVISALILEDYNGDGSLLNDLKTLGNRRVFLDSNRNGQFDSGEPMHITSSTSIEARDTFSGLTAGFYDVRIEPLDDWVVTTVPVRTVEIRSGSRVSSEFGNFQLGIIGGRVLEYTLQAPSNDPSKFATDKNGISGRLVFLDSNNNGRLDNGEIAAITDSEGHYQLTDVGPGPQHVRNVLPPGWIALPSDAEHEISVKSGVAFDFASYSDVPSSRQSPAGPGSYFLNKYIGTVSGQVTAGVGKEGVIVFVDADNDGQLDAGETSAITDSNGNFALTRPLHTSPNTHDQNFVVRLQIPFGFRMSGATQSFETIAVPFQEGVFDFPKVSFDISPKVLPPIFTDGFDRGNTSVMGDDWREVAGNLSINRSLVQSSPGPNLAIYNSLAVLNVDLQAQIGIKGFSPEAGLVGRYQEGSGNMYVGLIYRGNAEIWSVVNGVRKVLVSTPASRPSGTLQFIVNGSSLQLNLGTLHLAVDDTSIKEPGQVGIYLDSATNTSALDDFFARL